MASVDTTYGGSELTYVDYEKQVVSNSSELLKHSPIAVAFLESIAQYLNQQQKDLIWMCENILNLEEATGWQLDLIGQVVGQERLLASFDTGVYFGFKGSYQSDTFGDLNDSSVGGYWYNGNNFNVGTAKLLNDEQYKRVLKARIIKNNTRSCCFNDLIEVINLLVDNTNAVVWSNQHGLIQAKTTDDEGLLSYFLSRKNNKDNILPIPLGVKFEMIDN